MKKSLIKNEQKNESLKKQDYSFDQTLQFAKDQIEMIRQKVLKDDYEPTSEMLKIEVSGEHQTKELQQFILSSNGLKSFKGHQKQKQLFAQEFFLCDKKPLKIVKKKDAKQLFCAFYKDLKINSSFCEIISINTIVIGRIYDQFLWPAIIVNVQHVKTSDNYGKFIYKVNFIDSQKSYSLFKKEIIEFTPQNIGKIKRFFDSKKLNKALKIAEKMFHQSFEKNKVLQLKNSESIIKIKQIPLSIPIKLQNNEKQKLMNLVIETPRIIPKLLIIQNDCQADSNQQVKSHLKKKSFTKDISQDQTQYRQQRHRSQQKSLKSTIKDKIGFTKNKQEKYGYQLQKYFKQKQQKYKQQSSFFNVLKYISRYRSQLRYIKPRKNQKNNTMVKKVFQFLSLPLTNFKIKYFSGYSRVVDNLLFLCTEDYVDLKDQDNQFIKRSKKVLSKLYHNLKDYEGQNEFINALKMLQLCKLKDFEDNNFENIFEKSSNLSMISTANHK